jgi:hypothetical protein
MKAAEIGINTGRSPLVPNEAIPRKRMIAQVSRFRNLANKLAAFNAHIIASNIILDGIQQLERSVFARWSSLGFPFFSFLLRLVFSQSPASQGRQ